MDADVVVVGAGAAGLAAARRLAGLSRRVIVVEARDRVGGRVLSHRFPGLSAPADLGAEFIHGRGAETLALLREAGSEAVENGGAAWACAAEGEMQRDDRDFDEAARALAGAHSLAHDESAERFLQRLESDARTHRAAQSARVFVEGFEAADPARASVKSIADELRSGVDTKSARPLGGYWPMFEHLRDACFAAGVELRASTLVRNVSWRAGEVEVETVEQGRAQTIGARAAVMTVPIGVLRTQGDEGAVAFAPDLPPAKHNALAHIEMGQAVKVVLRFREAFWEEINGRRYRDAAFFRCWTQPFAGYWTQFPTRSTLITAWGGGPKALALAGTSQAEVIELALNGFGALFHDQKLIRAEIQDAAMHDWHSDPFARGAYSYVTVGGGHARMQLGAPVANTLFFAGEATSTDGQGGTVNGALQTGERAAMEVAGVLGASES